MQKVDIDKTNTEDDWKSWMKYGVLTHVFMPMLDI
jgi:hypothetical protein